MTSASWGPAQRRASARNAAAPGHAAVLDAVHDAAPPTHLRVARELELQGRSPVQAVVESCRLRLRPILMTSIAFIAGVIPLVLSSGAGAEVRQAMGIAVMSGMIGVTVFGLVLTPVFYAVLRVLSPAKLHHAGRVPTTLAHAPDAPTAVPAAGDSHA